MENQTPLPFVGLFAMAFWATYLWTFFVSEWSVIRHSKTSRPSDSAAPNQDELGWMMGITLVAQALAIASAFWPTGRFSVELQVPMFWLGISLLLAGSALRQHCFRMLGENFTIDVRVSENQPIIDRGAYAVIRHPGYTAGIIMLTGIGVALGSLLSTLIMLSSALFVYIRRINFEEQALERVLGEKYRKYAVSRKKLFPYVY